jgi:hypothetical protein
MLTCQLLCEVLLDCPLVWSKINIGWPRAQCELYTTLARGAPLSVRNSNSSVDPQCYFEVATSVHLDFAILYPDRPDFLGGNPRALRELTLVGFQLTYAPNFGGLKRLTLRLCLDGDRLWSFLDIFSHTPQLEDLSIIQRASNSGLPAIVMHQNRVLALQGDNLKTFLPRLLRLHLSDYVLPIWPIVRALRDPALELHLDVIEFSKSLDAWSQYHDNVLAHVKDVWQQKTGTGYPSSGTYTINLAFREPFKPVDHHLSYEVCVAGVFHVSFSAVVIFKTEFEDIHVLKFILNAEYVAFTINRISIFGLDFMPNIHTIILENAGDHSDMLGDSGLEEFIDARVNSV